MTNDRDVAQQPGDPGIGREATHQTASGMVATAAGQTDLGCQRSVNQDTLGNRVGDYAAQAADLGLLYAVADGMGGHARGEVASAMAIDQLFARFYAADPREEPQQALHRVMIETNAAVFQAGRDAGGGSMGTTLTLALLRDGHLYVGNIGDSRTYRVRGGQIEQLTHDHSLIGEQVRNKLLTEAQARQSSIRNVITRAVGYREQVEADVFAYPVAPGDIILLCSDGLHSLADSQELAQALQGQPLGTAVPALIELARSRGGSDNITALAVRVEQLGTIAAARDDEATLPGVVSPDDAVTKPFVRVEGEEAPGAPPAIGAAPPAPAPPAAGAPPAARAARAPRLPTAPPIPVAERPAAIPAPPSPPRQPNRLPLVLLVALPLVLLTLAGGAFVAARRGGASNPGPPATSGVVSSLGGVTPTGTAVAPTAVVAVASAPLATATPTTAVALVAATPAAPTATRLPPTTNPGTSAQPTPIPVSPAVPSNPSGSTPEPSSARATFVIGTIFLNVAGDAQSVPGKWEVVVYAPSAFPNNTLPTPAGPPVTAVNRPPTAQQLAGIAPTWTGTITANGSGTAVQLNYTIEGLWNLPGTTTTALIALRNRADPARVVFPEGPGWKITLDRNAPLSQPLTIDARLD